MNLLIIVKIKSFNIKKTNMKTIKIKIYRYFGIDKKNKRVKMII